MSVKLTIGTAVYNVGEDMLREHIECVMKQLTDETELLLIDDCSTDKSGEICLEYAGKNNHIRYINMGKNQGLGCVRNRTIDEARGKWIFFADGDDLVSEYAVKTALTFCDTNYDIIIHDRKIFVDNKSTDTECKVKKLTELPKNAGRELSLSVLCLKHIDHRQLGLGDNAFYTAAWGAVYRRDFLLNNNLKFTPGMKRAEDNLFNANAYFYAENIAYLPYVMYYYRNNMHGVTKRYDENFVEHAAVINNLLSECLHKLYPNDTEAEDLYKYNRVICLIFDSIRLKFFNSEYDKPNAIRKKEFFKFINTEPYKSAIDGFDFATLNRGGWIVPLALIKKRNFAALNLLMNNKRLYNIVMSITSRIIEIRKKFQSK